MATPTTAPARVRTAKSPGSRPVRSASASARAWVVLASSSSMRPRTAGTAMASSVVSRICAHSASPMRAKAACTPARSAAMGLISGGCSWIASSQSRSRSSWRTTSSLVGK